MGSCGNSARHWSRQGQQHSTGSTKTEANLDGADPRSTFSWTDGPPFLSHPGGVTVSADGGEKKDRGQCDAKDAKETHLGTRNQEKSDSGWGTAPTPRNGALIAQVPG